MSTHLDQDDLRKLEEGFATGADSEELALAEAVLKKLGYVKISSQPPSKRKTGPKPKASTNPTESEIHIRIEFLRMVLGEPANDLTVAGVLAATLCLLQWHETHCRSMIYLNDLERAKLHMLNSRLTESDFEFPDFLDSPVGWPSPMLWEPLNFEDVQDIVGELCRAVTKSKTEKWADIVEKSVSNPLIGSDESTLFQRLKIQLKLQPEESAAGLKEQIAAVRKKRPRIEKSKRAMAEELDLLESKLQKATFFEEATSKNETLRASISMLYRIRFLVDDCKPAEIVADTETLYCFVSGVNYGLPDDRLPSVLSDLHEVFVTAIQRQRHNPFSVIFNEEMDPAPPDIPEDGQLRATHLGKEKKYRKKTRKKVVEPKPQSSRGRRGRRTRKSPRK